MSESWESVAKIQEGKGTGRRREDLLYLGCSGSDGTEL